ncbi:hypothetical protein J6590_033229 [Homalodisca vitripennis]|nr:hypothetical protein J6590_033229 [Homalodisca vitripennis]
MLGYPDAATFLFSTWSSGLSTLGKVRVDADSKMARLSEGHVELPITSIIKKAQDSKVARTRVLKRGLPTQPFANDGNFKNHLLKKSRFVTSQWYTGIWKTTPTTTSPGEFTCERIQNHGCRNMNVCDVAQWGEGILDIMNSQLLALCKLLTPPLLELLTVQFEDFTGARGLECGVRREGWRGSVRRCVPKIWKMENMEI